MAELIGLDIAGRTTRLGARPVSLGEYRDYLRATGQPVPATISRARDMRVPAVYVSQIAARDYCSWLASQEGHPYRLPTTAELLQLAGNDAKDGVSPELWPHTHNERPEVQGEVGSVYLCEWTGDAEELPPVGAGAPRILGGVFYPPWLRQGNNPTQIQAMMLATQGYSFVSFRMATDS